MDYGGDISVFSNHSVVIHKSRKVYKDNNSKKEKQGGQGMSEKLKGIDVSGYQGNIDFKEVKASGIDFALIKAGYSTSTVPTWERNYANAKNSGLMVGAYWYSYAKTVEQGIAEARAFIAALKGKQLDFPVYLDIEEKAQFDKGKAFCTELVEAFCGELEKAGYYAGVYCSTYWYTNFVEESVREKRPAWIADYRAECGYKGNYGIWQYDTAKVPGVQYDCDRDVGYVDYSLYIKANGLNGYTTEIAPDEVKKSVDELAQEVLNGLWGNGQERADRLEAAGYSYDDVQKRVNEILFKTDYLSLSELVGTTGAVITTAFRQKGSIWSSGWHNGVDIACPASTNIYAAADGEIFNADTAANSDGYGNRCIILHSDGKATLYAHMVSKAIPKVGEKVQKGQLIGRVGSTGKSTGPHLHFTVLADFMINQNIYYKGNLLDPVIVCGMGNLKWGSTATPTVVTETVDKKAESAIKDDTEFKIGDVVSFHGHTHYASSTDLTGYQCKPGKAKITNINQNGIHPYHLESIWEDGMQIADRSTVYGWVNRADIVNNGGKSVDELAIEVIRGDWGDGFDRKIRLTKAGYDYSKIQKRVNEILYS